jgi:hypothetical protein
LAGGGDLFFLEGTVMETPWLRFYEARFAKAIACIPK